MSYDIRVWCVDDFDPMKLPDPEKWTEQNDFFVYETKSWQISLSRDRVEREDIPDEISTQLPGISYVVELSLSPISAARSAHAILARSAKTIGQVAHGVIEDPQTEEVLLPSGVKRYMKPEPEARASVLEFCWFVNNNALRDGEHLGRLVDLLKRHLPEAVPRRYGDYEPPKNKLEEQGEAHLRNFIRDTPKNMFGVFYTTRPVLNFHLSNSDEPGPSRLGYRANRFEITVEASVLKQPGWAKQLQAFWRATSLHLQPFYGEIRELHGHILRAGRLWSDSDSEDSPVASWWWNGLPSEAPLAAVVGPPYLDLWQSVSSYGVAAGELVFLEADDWIESRAIDCKIWAPPAAIVRPPKPPSPPGVKISGGIPTEYASAFPFEKYTES